MSNKTKLLIDEIIGTPGNDRLHGTDGDDTLWGLLGDDRLIGGNGNDYLFGGKDSDTLIGGDGDDALDGGMGNDVLIAGDGNDTLTGGSGDDKLNGNGGWDIATYSGDVRTYSFDKTRTGWEITSESDGADTIRNIEQLNVGDVTLFLDGRNNAPVAFEDAVDVDENPTGEVELNLTGNDWDFEGDNLTVISIDDSGTTGSVLLDTGTGKVTYDPNGQFENLGVNETAEDSFTYTISDGNGGMATATVLLTIKGENDTPTVAGAITSTASEDDSSFSIDLLLSASDVDTSDTLSITNLTTVSGDDAGFTLDGTNLLVDPSVYDALNDGESEIVTFNYDISDGNGGIVAQTATITINGVTDEAAGNAVDGYFQGSTVFVDSNDNQMLDAGEDATVTDGFGAFMLTSSGALVMTGGRDISTELEFAGVLRAPEGSTVITSLSSIVSALMDAGDSKADAEGKVLAGFANLTGVSSVLTVDPVASTLAAEAGGAEMMTTASQVLNTVAQIAAYLVGAGATDMKVAYGEIFHQIAVDLNGLAVSATYDLTVADTVQDLIFDTADALTLTGSIQDTIADAAAVIAGVNQFAQDTLDSSPDGEALLTELAQVGIVAQGEISDALGAVTGSDDPILEMSTISTDYSDSTLATQIADAAESVGDIDGIVSVTYNVDGFLVPSGANVLNVNVGVGGDFIFLNTNYFDFNAHRTVTTKSQVFQSIEELVIDDDSSPIGHSNTHIWLVQDFSDSLLKKVIFMGGDFPNETLHTSASESDGQASNGLRIEAHGGHGSDILHGDNLADALYGDEGSDRLFGYGGEDILAGGPGYDSLTGGSGADRFVFLDGDAGVTVNQFGTFVQTDTILDFNQADGDVLDLADLLSGLGGLTEDGASLAAFADVMLDPLDSNNTIITVDSDNDGTFDFNIKLSGVDLIGSGAPSAEIFQALIDGGNLDIV